MADIARIEDRIDRVAASALEVSDALGGLRFQNMVEVMEFAKCMAVADTAVPKHLRGNPGMCLAVTIQALEWRFSPFAVANKSYVVNDRIGYESQLVHAVIEQRAPIRGRLQHKYEGEGDERKCTVWATLRETGETLEYTSPAFGKIQPKNSPLWKTKPDLQLYYNTSRDFCRAYFPDVLLGVYSQDELRDHVGPDNAKDVTKPDVASRLKGGKGRGFSHQHVERETRGGVIEEHVTEAQREAGINPPRERDTGDEAQTSEQEPLSNVSGAAHARMSEAAAPTLSNSSQATPQASPTETDKPASASAVDAGNNSGSAAGQDEAVDGEVRTGDDSSSAGSPSTLAPDWQQTYLTAMQRATDRPKSLLNRHSEAIQLIGGKANSAEQEWMRAVYDLRKRNLEGELSKAEYDAAIREMVDG